MCILKIYFEHDEYLRVWKQRILLKVDFPSLVEDFQGFFSRENLWERSFQYPLEN